jgi:hypothetical protein
MGSEHLSYFKQERKVVGDFLQIDLPYSYLKPMDDVLIKAGKNLRTIATVRRVGIQCAYLDILATPDNFIIGMHRTSISSNLKTIANLCTGNDDGTHLMTLLRNAKCVDGYGGSGKSEYIINHFTKNQLIITCTSVAKENLIQRGLPTSNVMTLERASSSNLTNYAHLVIDEANMINYLDLNRLIHSGITNLSLFYDSTQISKFDSISLAGRTNLCLITEYPLTVEKWRRTYRYGPTLCKFLEPLLPDIESGAKHDTLVNVVNVAVLSPDWLVKYIKEHTIDVILNAYTREVNIIKSILNDVIDTHDRDLANVTVNKLHSYQSKEADNVMVLQWRENNKPMGLCRDKRYVISGLTRAKKSVHLVSVGHIEEVTNIINACSSIGGVARRTSDTLVDWLKHDVVGTVKLLNDKLRHDNLEFVATPDSVEIYKFGSRVGRFELEDGSWTANSHLPFVKNMLLDSLSKPPGVITTPEINNKVELTIENSDRVRALAWVCDMLVNSGRLALGGSMRGYYLKKTPGCPLMCGLSMYHNSICVLDVTSSWATMNNRIISADANDDGATLMSKWLQGQHTNTFLDNIVVPCDMELNMIIDRAFTLPSAAVEYGFGKKKLSPKTSIDNAAWAATITSKHGFSTNFRWRSSVRHNMLIIERRLSSPLLGRMYAIMHHTGVRNFSVWSSDDVYADVFNMALSTVQPIMRKKRLIGAVEYGMYLSVEEHMSNNTKVGKELGRLKFKQDLRLKDSIQSTVSISNEAYSSYITEIKDQKLDIPVIKHNAVSLCEPEQEVIDAYLIARFGSVGQGVNVGYMGMNPVLCGVSNRHYMKILQPPAKDLLFAWDATVDLYKSWFDSFVDRLKESLVEKAETIKTYKSALTKEQESSKLQMLERQRELSTMTLTTEHYTKHCAIKIIGSLAILLNPEQLAELADTSNLCVLALPQSTEQDHFLTDTIKMRKDNKVTEIKHAGVFECHGKCYELNVFDNLLGYTLYVLTKTVKVTPRNINKLEFADVNVVLNAPTINLTNSNERNLLVIKSTIVNKRIMQRCLNYGLANNCNLNKMMSYIRSLLSTYDTSRTGIFPTYFSAIESAQTTAIAAVCMTKIDRTGMVSLADLLIEMPELMNGLLSIFKTLNKDDAMLDLFNGALSRLTSRLGINLRELTEAMDAMRVKMLPVKTNILPVLPWSDGMSSVLSSEDDNPSNNDGDDDDDSVDNNQSSERSMESSWTPQSTLKDDDGNATNTNFFDPNVSDSTSDMSASSNLKLDEATVVEDMQATISSSDEETKVSDARAPSNLFDPSPVITPLDELMKLWDQPHMEEHQRIWVYWQPSINEKENLIVNRCIDTIKRSQSLPVTILDKTNEKEFIPDILMQYKTLTTIQAWSDIVRMWLLYKYGGVWSDASVYCDVDCVNLAGWLHHPTKNGLMFYQRQDGPNVTMDNWFIVCKPGLDLMSTWAKAFMTIIYHGNDSRTAIPDLQQRFGEIPAHYNPDENYLTMHEASKFVAPALWKKNFTLFPGFAGPLAWITPNMDFPAFVRRLTDPRYRGIMGVTKLINLSRKLLIELPTDSIESMFNNLETHRLTKQCLVLGMGTRGDHVTATELARNLENAGVTADLLLVGSSVVNESATNIVIDVDPLSVANPTSISGVASSLSYMRNVMTKLLDHLEGKHYNYMYANFHIPGLMAISRLTGGMAIQIGGPPLHNTESECAYFTSSGAYEKTIDSIMNSMLATYFQKSHTHPFSGLVNGLRSLPHWYTTSPQFVQKECVNISSHCVGSLITGDVFDSANGQLAVASIQHKVDILMLGPSIDRSIVQRSIAALAKHKSASSLLVIGTAMANLCSSKTSKVYKSIKRLYSRVQLVGSVDILTLKGKVGLAVTHGGCGTVDDMHKVGATHISVGLHYDQQYWSTRSTGMALTPLDEMINDVHNINRFDFTTASAIEYLTTNSLPTLLLRSRGSCTYEVIYNPTGQNNCVSDCYQKFCEYTGIELIDSGVNFLPLMDHDSMLIALCSRQINARVVKNDGHYIEYAFNNKWPFIELLLLPARNILHCVLVKLKDVRTQHTLLTENYDLKYKGEMHSPRLHTNNEINNEWVEFMTSGLCLDTYYTHNVIRDKFARASKSKNWLQRSKRMGEPIRLACCNSIGPNQISVNAQLILGKVYIIVSANVVQYGVCSITGDISVLFVGDKGVNGVNLIFDIGCNLFVRQSDLTDNFRHSPANIFRPLNRTTLASLRRMTVSVPYTTDPVQVGDNLIITDYDNRGHDKYDEQNLINSANEIHWVCDIPLNKLERLLSLTYNRSIRVILHTGVVKTEIVTHSQSARYLASAIFKYYNMTYATGGSCRAHGTFPEDVYDKLRDNYSWVASHKGQQESTQTLTMSKQEWIDKLGIDLGDWNVIELIMIQNNERFSAEVTTKGPVEASRLSWVTLTQDKYEICNSKVIFSYKLCAFLRVPKTGGEIFMNQEKISLGNSKDWWKPIGNEDPILKDIAPDNRASAMINTDVNWNANVWTTTITYENLIMEEQVNCEEVELTMSMENCADHVDHTIVPHTIQNLWQNTDLTMDLRQYAPINKGTIRSKENPDAIIETTKFVLNNPVPMESRPILTKWAFEDHRSISGRLFSKLKLRRPRLIVSPAEMCKKLINVYFTDAFVPYTRPDQILDIDEFETALWISKRRDGVKIQSELNELFSTELGVIPLNAINVHLKLESLLKEKPIMHWGEHQARAIYWQRKAIAAISSPVFLKAKTRLKESLDPKFVYADGMTPKELTHKCRQVTDVEWFFENDLSKQDRQTDKPTLDAEMKLYSVLGVSTSMLTWWKTMHEVWRFRSRWNKGYAQEMRLTGQSTTSLGNLITNMQVHCEFFKRNASITQRVLFLGDDMLAMMSKKPEVDWLAKHSKLDHNMTSKHYLSQDCGLFCCMIAYKNSIGSCDLGPDFTRLKFRFEVTNGVSQATEENILARCQSYACMLGNTDEMRQLKTEKNWSIPLENWYDQSLVVNSICNRYDLTESEVKGHYAQLVEYLNNPKPEAIVFNHYRACKKY